VRERKRKPKFQIGRVVSIRKGYMHEGFCGRVISVRPAKDGLEYMISWLPSRWAIEFALRNLTKRERGT
jgi:transcription antitermination factor NusG